MGVLVGEDEMVERQGALADLGWHPPTVPCTALPSNGDEELLDGSCMADRLVLQLVR
jgi:hypothetical protein